MKILIIEDNPRLASRMKQQLRKWYMVETAQSGDEGLRCVAINPYDTILLDLGLPDATGLEVCRQIRRISKDIPILIVTGIDSIESKVSLFESGADDYITKPFSVDELRARINTLARRRKRNHNEALISVGDLVIDPARRAVSRAGVEITLRRKEFDILEYLALNAGRVMSREMIVDHAWVATSTTWTGSVDVHIKQIRDKIDKPFSYPLIKTSYGVGYIIETPVKKDTAHNEK